MVFINVYAPTDGNERVRFLHEISAFLNTCNSDDLLFLAGDFNCTEDDSVDRNNAEPHAASKHALKQVCRTHDLVDIWRRIHNNDRQYTWAHTRENIVSLTRLDRFYVFKHHFNICKSCEIMPLGFSDHSLVLCHVFIRNIKHRSAYWHFNTSLLCDSRFKEGFKFLWNKFKNTKTEFESLRQWWDYGKVKIRQFCQQ